MSTVIRLKRGEIDEEVMVQDLTNQIVGQPLLRFINDEPSYIYTFDGKIDDKFNFTRFGSDIISGKGLGIVNVSSEYPKEGSSYYYSVNFREINVNVTPPLYINSNNYIAINVGSGLGIVNNQLVVTGGSGSSYEEGLNIEIDNDDLIHSFRFIPALLSDPAPQLSDVSYNLIGTNSDYGITPTFDKVSTFLSLKVKSFIGSDTLVINLFDNDFRDNLIQENVIHHINIYNISPEYFKVSLRAITTDPDFKMIDVTNNSTYAVVDNTVNVDNEVCYYLGSIFSIIPNKMAELSFIKYKDADGTETIAITHT